MNGVAQRGTVTAELAIALPAVVILLGVVLAVGVAVSAQLRCTDAARAGARAAARDEPRDVVVALAERAAPDGARVSVQLSGTTAVVRVSAAVRLPLPGRPALTVAARAVADLEQPSQGGLTGPSRARDRGSGTVLALAVGFAAVSMAWAGAGLGSAVLARHRAETAADLAALAAAARPQVAAPGACQAAARLAMANGARLLTCRAGGNGAVSVSVAVPVLVPGLGPAWGSATASARAGPADAR